MTATKYNKAEYRAYNEGYDAFEMFMNGAPKVINPFKRGSAMHAAWKDGYDEAASVNAERIAVQARDANTVGYY